MNGWHASIILDVLLACLEWNGMEFSRWSQFHFTSLHFAGLAHVLFSLTWLCFKSVAVPAWPVYAMLLLLFFWVRQEKYH